jgi:hypothetical protein
MYKYVEGGSLLHGILSFLNSQQSKFLHFVKHSWEEFEHIGSWITWAFDFCHLEG